MCYNFIIAILYTSSNSYDIVMSVILLLTTVSPYCLTTKGRIYDNNYCRSEIKGSESEDRTLESTHHIAYALNLENVRK